MSEPLPPQNLEAEESVLGAMLLSPLAIEAASEILTSDDFYRKTTHGIIYKAALEMHTEGKPVDAVTLAAELERRGSLNNIGGKVRIQELASLMPATSNVAHHAQIIRDCTIRRNLIRAGAEIAKLGWEGNGEVGELASSAEVALSQAMQYEDADTFHSASSAVNEVLDEIAHAVETGQEISGIKTGLPSLDRLTTGLYGGQLIVIGARPSVGKSVLSLNIAQNVAYKTVPVGFITLEMSNKELAQRSVARLSKVPLTNIRTGKVTPEQHAEIKHAASLIHQWPLYWQDQAVSTLPEIVRQARRLHRQKGIGLLVVDYLQLVGGSGQRRDDTRQQEVSDISRGLKLLAKELDIPVIACSQLNRKSEEKDRPGLSDLRESGSIEQDADTVLFIHREGLYKILPAEQGCDAEIIVAKARMGETGTINALFFGKRQQFGEPARHQTERNAA